MTDFDPGRFISGLSPELREKAHACKSAKELLQFADENDIELPHEALDMISGGACSSFFCFHEYQKLNDEALFRTDGADHYKWYRSVCRFCGDTKYYCFFNGSETTITESEFGRLYCPHNGKQFA